MPQRGRPRKNPAPSTGSAGPGPTGSSKAGRDVSPAGSDQVRSADYRYDAITPLRPEVGAAPAYLNQAKSKREPTTYRYDSSLAPVLEWDGNPVRELGEWLIAKITEAAALPAPHAFAAPQVFSDNRGRAMATVRTLREAADQLARLGKPFLNWTGKAERQSFDVPTMPLFVHERLSTKAIIDTLTSFRKQPEQQDLFDLFADPQHSVADQVLKAYEHQDKWANRLILGDSMVVMNSLLKYENLGGQVQMIYMDPPYGVKFGSNFQPFIKKRDVGHNDDEDLTREPEMVQAYRDTWELGLHSYLTYLRERLSVSRSLLTETGSVFVQINDENVHHVREVMDEVFGKDNFIAQINFQTTSGFKTKTIATVGDFLLWYAKDLKIVKVNKLYAKKTLRPGEGNASWVLFPDKTYRGVSSEEKRGDASIPDGAKLYNPGDLTSQGAANQPQPYLFEGKTYYPGANAHWKPNYPEGLDRLAAAGRIHVAKNSIRYRRFSDDFPFSEIGNIWTDTLTGSFTDDKIYAVQTNLKVAERCILLATDPGDLVIDPTCGSGTTVYMAEQWGRRWITCDVSRVPLALARQRLLTATFPWYQLKDLGRGPSGGFHYERRQNRKGEEVGGIVPHIMLENIANNEPSHEEVLVDRPERDDKTVRVCGPFVVEGSIPPAQDLAGQDLGPRAAGAHVEGAPAARGPGEDEHAAFTARMIEILRKTPILRLAGNKQVKLTGVRQPAKSLVLNAEAIAVNGEDKPTAFVFGPENGQVVERLVVEALREAQAKQFKHLVVIGFAIHPNARQTIEHADTLYGLPASYVQATPDLLMGDLLKNMRSSQIFSVCGLPEIAVTPAAEEGCAQVELLGLDVFEPITMDVVHRRGDEVPAWFLDTDYNGMCFKVSQAFFPKTGAWDNLKKSLKITHDEAVWDHLAGTISAPFRVLTAGQQVAVKVIDERGNELVVTKPAGVIGGKKGRKG